MEPTTVGSSTDGMTTSCGFTMIGSNIEGLINGNDDYSAYSDPLPVKRGAFGMQCSQPKIEFVGIKDVYVPSENILVSFHFTEEKSESIDTDFIGLYPADWKSPDDFYAKVTGNDFLLDECKTNYFALFTGKDPLCAPEKDRDRSGYFNFIYFSSGRACAISEKFRFEIDPEYIEIEDPSDPGLVVFKSRNSHSVTELLPDSILDTSKLSSQMEELSLNAEDFSSIQHQLIELLPDRVLDTSKLSSQMEELSLNTEDVSSIQQQLIEVKNTISELKDSCVTKDDLKSLSQVIETISSSVTKLKEKPEENISIKSTCPSVKRCEKSVEEKFDVASLIHSVESFYEIHQELNQKLMEKDEIIDNLKENLEKSIEVNEKLSQELTESKESSAYLNSRVSVLELELRTMNEQKYRLLMQCIDAYEQENASLKEEVNTLTKSQCELESIRNKCKELEQENLHLRKYFTTDDKNAANESEIRKSLASSVKGLQAELADALKQNQLLSKQLLTLRKQSIGKVSLEFLKTDGPSDDDNE